MKALSFRCHVISVALVGLLSIASTIVSPALGQAKRETITWVKGTVRDEAGKPVDGAEVYARAIYYGGIRMNGSLSIAITGADGGYTIQGEGGLQSFSATLVAHVPGRPPAMSWFSLPEPRRYDEFGFKVDEKLPATAEIDLVIPDRGGRLDVLVTRNGKPVPKASVALRLEGADPFDSWGLEHQTDEHKRLHAICRPTRPTGADGVAHFDALLPGLYSVFAAEGKDESALGLTEYHRWFPFGDPPTYGESRHVAIRVGEMATHQLALFQHGCVTKFEVIQDGKNWIEKEQLQLDHKLPNGDAAARATWIGKQWTDTYRFETASIARVSFTKYTGSPRKFPFVSADGVMAASPRLSNATPVSLTAQENRGGMIYVRIQDENGRRLAGLAKFSGVRVGGGGMNTSFRDVAEDGSLISEFEPAPGRVEAIASGRQQIVPSEKMGSMPPSKDLVGRSEILPVPVVTRNNEQVEITLRYEKVGYVRGRLLPPTGRASLQYRVYVGQSDYRAGAGIFYKPDTGEFLAGPYRSGKAILRVSAEHGLNPFLQHEVDVRAGEVAEVELQIPVDGEKSGDRLQSVTGRVWQADGTTPAKLAALARWNPGEQHVWRTGMTDTGGFIRHRSYWYLAEGDEVEPEPDGTPREPVYLAWQPGQCGATIVPMPKGNDRSLAIKLSEPISLHGQVTLLGDGAIVDNGTITVRAQYRGWGKLDDLLSVETTAGADGKFELSGLTPGKYRVQAALDGIWVSQSLDFKVGEKLLEPVTLTIQPPGGPVLVRLTGERSRSPEKLITYRPAGPLTDRLWPKFLVPDGAGVIRIPALEAGKHFIRIGDIEKVVEVLPLSQSKGRPVEVEWK